MKNRSQFYLIIITLFFVVFTCGVLLGKHLDNSISLENTGNSKTQSEKTDTTASDLETNVVVDGKININVATVDELVLLPGIGETLANRIVNYRQMNGQFSTVDDLKNVEGIGAGKLEAIRQYITAG